MTDAPQTTGAAQAIAGGLTSEERSAMLSLAHYKLGWRDAVSADTDWMVEIELRRKGLIRFSRGGDNASSMTALGARVRDLLEAAHVE